MSTLMEWIFAGAIGALLLALGLSMAGRIGERRKPNELLRRSIASLIDRILPQVCLIVLAIVFMVYLVLNHIDDASNLAAGAKDILLLLIGTVIGGLISMGTMAFRSGLKARAGANEQQDEDE